MFGVPNLGSYLTAAGKSVHEPVVQGTVLMFDDQAMSSREINVRRRIAGHTFANARVTVLAGQEQPNEDWRIALVNPPRGNASR